ncbi:hypothetical protein E2C01_039885 [Portunus trituberculatus]|uniref:Uncharacterized protein n=1 Tax=Portunus trituberculatus TaxID=210409 RepID=A0A5B7FL74_PORTR|nr:hypothetical protein [Portunus trituberculatus]
MGFSSHYGGPYVIIALFLLVNFYLCRFVGIGGNEDSCSVRLQEIGRFYPVFGDSVGGAVPVYGDSLSGAAQDMVGALVWLHEGPVDSIHTDEHV